MAKVKRGYSLDGFSGTYLEVESTMFGPAALFISRGLSQGDNSILVINGSTLETALKERFNLRAVAMLRRT